MAQDKQPTVLIVEDQADVCSSLRVLLSLVGCQTVSASNGQEALDYLHDNSPPCLILLDLRMPVMSGVEFLHRRMLESALMAIPVVVCSGEVSGKHEAAEHGVDYCCKGSDPVEILGLVSRYCGVSFRQAC